MSIIPSLLAMMMHHDRQRREMMYRKQQENYKQGQIAHAIETREYQEKNKKQILIYEIQALTHSIEQHTQIIKDNEKKLADALEKLGHLHD